MQVKGERVPPTRPVILTGAILALSLLCAAAIAYDINVRRDRPLMKAVEVVSRATAIYAVAPGFVFHYVPIAPMLGLGFRERILAAEPADNPSSTTLEVGRCGWKALTCSAFSPAPHLTTESPASWLRRQLGTCLGLPTAHPVDAWLLLRGSKEAM
jgi:hypothetical protein